MADRQTSPSVRFYIEAVLAVGGTVWIYAGLQHSFGHGTLFWACLAMALFAATLKVRLPGVEGTFSLGFVGSLVAVQQLDFTEAVVVGTLVGVMQSLWRPLRRPLAIQVAFNAANVANSTAVAFGAYRGWLLHTPNNSSAWLLLWAAALFYAVNTGIVSGVLCLLEQKPLAQMFEHWCLWSFSYYLAGALLAVFLQSIAGSPLVPLALLVPMFIVYFVYRGHIRGRRQSNQSDQVFTVHEILPR
jgi:hypothetical protein